MCCMQALCITFQYRTHSYLGTCAYTTTGRKYVLRVKYELIFQSLIKGVVITFFKVSFYNYANFQDLNMCSSAKLAIGVSMVAS